MITVKDLKIIAGEKMQANSETEFLENWRAGFLGC